MASASLRRARCEWAAGRGSPPQSSGRRASHEERAREVSQRDTSVTADRSSSSVYVPTGRASNVATSGPSLAQPILSPKHHVRLHELRSHSALVDRVTTMAQRRIESLHSSWNRSVCRPTLVAVASSRAGSTPRRAESVCAHCRRAGVLPAGVGYCGLRPRVTTAPSTPGSPSSRFRFPFRSRYTYPLCRGGAP
jgi:hypothetical protein